MKQAIALLDWKALKEILLDAEDVDRVVEAIIEYLTTDNDLINRFGKRSLERRRASFLVIRC
ncbi:hypothetical protein [Paraburkholderia kirstenboschensis]|uniref:Uncharacterized protein n=1 Tax=Paraburkholderia kirstenboschensis TaxID=1245436 RepID=A0ABZ0EL51_9BURK|nr:hypothetical protein [Paraburkholderia kirstenboschensis]WOD17017.1 hypothetical protein RW095_14340 [Paraburkholderia kirstenboschensis]